MSISSAKTKKKDDFKVIVSSESPDLYTTQRFLKAGTELGVETSWINPYESKLLVSPQNNLYLNGLYLHRTTGIRYDDFDLTYAQHMYDCKMKVSNPISSLTLFRKKDEQQLFFKRNNLPFIPTFIYRGKLHEESKAQFKKLSSNETYILKMNRGNGGIGVNLVNGLQSLCSFLETFHGMQDQKFIIQPYIKHTKEYRVFFAKEDILGIVEKKINANDFRGNAKRSKGVYKKRLSQKLRDVCFNAFKHSQLDYAGIDIIENENGYFLLEINPIPGFLQLEELSKINIAKEILLRLI